MPSFNYSSSYNNISPKEVETLLQNASVVIIDVRESGEYRQGYIPGAINIPLGQIPLRYHEIDRSKNHIILYCTSGMRSGRACDYLSKQGYAVSNMTGGLISWKGNIQK